MKATINKLSIDLINKIAAGEVIQRPSSVIKELVENSIDAESTDIKLLIKDYGKTLIEISDNGVGMNEKDLRLCFLKHTTSKISKSSRKMKNFKKTSKFQKTLKISKNV